MRLLVLGAGGIGGYFGARIHAAGGDVTFLARPARAATLRENGLQVFSPHGDLQIQPNVLTRDELRDTFDAVILSCKAYDLDAAMDDIAPAGRAGNAVAAAAQRRLAYRPPCCPLRARARSWRRRPGGAAGDA